MRNQVPASRQGLLVGSMVPVPITEGRALLVSNLTYGCRVILKAWFFQLMDSVGAVIPRLCH